VRTTLTLDDDLARELHERARRTGRPFKEVVNDAIRAGLRGARSRRKQPRFVVQPFSGGYLPGIDPERLNQRLDEVEIEDYLASRSQETAPTAVHEPRPGRRQR
jgi:metal-responsive CopG/Arc/MetJ family transcriptional regulator